jgi:glycosyltransferase involved in cell wall biosynthesis
MTLTRTSLSDAPEGSTPGVDRLALVYLIGTYPLMTTTFIDREIVALRERGADVRVFSIRRPDVDGLSIEQRRLARDVSYLLPVRVRTLVRAHARFVLRHPIRYGSTLAFIATRPHPGPRARIKTLLHFGEGVAVADLIRRWRFREIHAHFLDRAATIALVVGRLLDIPYSLSVHAGADLFVAPTLIPEKVGRARHVATCTSHNRDRLVELAGDAAMPTIDVVHHGLDLSGLGSVEPRTAHPPTILSVGQLTERKGFAVLIEACAILHERSVPFGCEIVGRGPQAGPLERMIAACSLEGQVTVVGGLPHEEVVERYRRATVFALPCIRRADGDVDGIPNVLAEAMAASVPVVASDLPAVGELVEHGVDGLLPPSGDATALADALHALLEDPVARREMGAQGRRKVLEVFDLDRNIDRFVSALWPGALEGGGDR